jgi:iron(III) transport system permease protein
MKSVLDGLAFLPHTVPVVVLGLAWVLIGIHAHFIPIYGTIWIIALAQIGIFLPYTTRATNGAVLQIHSELEDAGIMSGARLPYVFRRILLPLLAPSLAAAALWVGIHAAGDFTLSVLLASPDSQPVSIYIWNNYLNGYLDRSPAAAIVLLILISLFLFGARALARLHPGSA